ncbi:MAG: TPM domain-containing protein [Bacteroidia bacterium]
MATGKGLEGAIPDATCHEIVDNKMIPHFKENNYYAGLNAATDVLMALAKGEYDYNTYSKQNAINPTVTIFIIIIILIIFFSIFSRIRRLGNRGYTMHGGGFFPFIGGGGWGGGSSGGSSGGGGFGGFGGGDFGGGGSGGSW